MDRDEFSSFVTEKMGSPERAAKAFSRLDTDGDGTLSRKELAPRPKKPGQPGPSGRQESDKEGARRERGADRSQSPGR